MLKKISEIVKILALSTLVLGTIVLLLSTINIPLVSSIRDIFRSVWIIVLCIFLILFLINEVLTRHKNLW